MKPPPSTRASTFQPAPPPNRPAPRRSTRPATHAHTTAPTIHGDDIEPAGREIHFAGRVIIFLEGDESDSIYKLVDGMVMLYKLMPDGRRQIIELLRAGDIFGFSPVAIHECSAESLVAGTCIAFKRSDLARSPALMQSVNEQIQTQICAMHDHAILLGRKTAMERVATFLMRWVPGRGGYHCLAQAPSSECADIRLRMTRHEIADYLGLTIETVSRCLSKLKRRSAIAIDHPDEITIKNVCRMCLLTGTEATCER